MTLAERSAEQARILTAELARIQEDRRILATRAAIVQEQLTLARTGVDPRLIERKLEIAGIAIAGITLGTEISEIGTKVATKPVGR